MGSGESPFTWVGIFFVGLGLNLTPCVYPMLSVTISLFSAQKSHGRLESLTRAIFYVLGIAFTNTTLGVFAALTGAFFGAALQHPVVLLGISVFLFLLALSMFGVYTFQLPSWIVNRVSGARKFNVLGFFFSGICVGVFAAPCIGPALLALLTWVATMKNVWFAVAVFFVLSMGLGFPYLLLGAFSGVLSKIPRSGSWLVWFERLFGVLLISLAFFYLALAVSPLLLRWVLPVSLVLGGIYLGFLEQSVKYSKVFDFFRKAAACAALLMAFLLSFSGPKQRVDWQEYSPEKLQASIQAHHPVILDFYADWCIPCHEMDHVTYVHPRVVEAMQSLDRYKVDLTQADQGPNSELAEQYQIEGVPTVVLLKPDGNEAEELRMMGYVGPEEFLETLRRLKKLASVPETNQ